MKGEKQSHSSFFKVLISDKTHQQHMGLIHGCCGDVHAANSPGQVTLMQVPEVQLQKVRTCRVTVRRPTEVRVVGQHEPNTDEGYVLDRDGNPDQAVQVWWDVACSVKARCLNETCTFCQGDYANMLQRTYED